MFWIDIGARKAIYSSNMNGEDINTLVNDNLDTPSGLAIDFMMNNRLYWTDTKLNTIESINIDGSDRMKITHFSIVQPYKLDVFENNVYWASKELGSIYKIDKFGRGSVTKIISGMNLIQDLKIFHPIKIPESFNNPCLAANCSHLCLLKPNSDFDCSCPDEYHMIDEDLSLCNAPIELELTNPLECLCHNCWCFYNNFGVHFKCLNGN